MQCTACTNDSNDHPRQSTSLRIITATLGSEKGWQICIILFVYIWLFHIAFLMCALLLGSPSILKKKQHYRWELYIIYVHSGIAVWINIYSMLYIDHMSLLFVCYMNKSMSKCLLQYIISLMCILIYVYIHIVNSRKNKEVLISFIVFQIALLSILMQALSSSSSWKLLL